MSDPRSQIFTQTKDGTPLFSEMTLRDYFAGQALAGIASMSGEDFSLSPEDEASWAYQRADAMLKARADQ